MDPGKRRICKIKPQSLIFKTGRVSNLKSDDKLNTKTSCLFHGVWFDTTVGLKTQHCAIKIDSEQQIFFVTGPFSPVFWQRGTESLFMSQASSVAVALLQLFMWCEVGTAPTRGRETHCLVCSAQKQTVSSRGRTRLRKEHFSISTDPVKMVWKQKRFTVRT